jgi:FkbM family methyltransferase
MRIMQGPMRDMRWIAGAHTHGCWLGSYELDKQLLLARTLKHGGVLYDIGANAGFYTLLGSRLLGPEGQVYAFEPNPRNLRYLNDHLRINCIGNARVFPLAVSDHAGTATFDADAPPAQGGLSEGGSLTVQTVALDDLVASGELRPPQYMKIDVEGAELLVLRGAGRILQVHRPIIFLATHGPSVHAACTSFLQSSGYAIAPIGSPGATLETADELLATPQAP